METVIRKTNGLASNKKPRHKKTFTHFREVIKCISKGEGLRRRHPERLGPSQFGIENKSNDSDDVDGMNSKANKIGLNVDTNFDITQCLLEDIKRVYRDDRRHRRKAWFYKFVAGGDVETVDGILTELKSRVESQELAWLLNKPAGSGEGGEDEPSPGHDDKPHGSSFIKNILVFLLMLLLSMVLTPVFYPVHAFLVYLRAYFRTKVTYESCELPLVVAALSESEEMVELFKNHGVSITDEDQHGKNVFHHLSDLSEENAEKSIQLMKMVVRLFDEDFDKFRDVLVERTNHAGLTAFETMLRYGSPKLLTAVVNTEGLVRRTIMSVRHGVSWLSLEDTDIRDLVDNKDATPTVFVKYTEAADVVRGDDDDEEESVCRETTACYDLRRFDITCHEKASISRAQISPLNLVTSRDIEGMSEEDVISLDDCRYLSMYIRKKISSAKVLIIFRKLLQAIFTLLFLLMVWIGDRNLNVRPLQVAYIKKLDMIRFQSENIGPHSNSTASSNVSSSCDLNMTSVDNLLLDSCEFAAYRDTTASCPSFLDESRLLEACGLIQTRLDDPAFVAIRHMLLIPTLVYLTFDIFSRATTLTSLMTDKKCHSVSASCSRMLAARFLGSYTAKTLTTIISITYLVHWVLFLELHRTVSHLTADQIRALDAQVKSVIIIVMVLRFVTLIWTLRLIPGIGNFIIGVYCMFKDIGNFAVVYGFVLICSAELFSFVLRDPSCPVAKVSGFHTMGSSLFQTYLAMLGEANFPFGTNFASDFVFVLYSIVTTLLLLNLIIAIMGRTTDTVMSHPWKPALYKMELLKESIEVENMAFFLLFPFRGVFHRWNLARHGFVVEKGGHQNTYRIYLEMEDHQQE